jgi:hypothetical protein
VLRGDWEGWLDFFLDGVATVGEEAVTSARELFATVAADRECVLNEAAASVERGNEIGGQSRMTILAAQTPSSGRPRRACDKP